MLSSRGVSIAGLLIVGALALPAPASSNATHLLEKRSTWYTECTIPGKVVAMTFDDGPYIYNTELVDYLNSEGVKATFFMNGNNYDCIYDSPYPSYVQHVYTSGHQIGSHTWNHPDLETLSNDEITQELVQNNEAFAYIIGQKPRYFRPPYGNIDENIDSLVRAQGQISVTWNFDSGDTTGSTVQESEAAYAEWISTGKSLIALNHETHPDTVNLVVKAVIPQLKQAGYRFVTIAECLDLGSAYVTPTDPKGPGHC